MANVTVPTTPPGVWPAETSEILDTTYAAVEADVLRRKTGDLLQDTDARDKADMTLKAGYAAPRITAPLEDTEVADGAVNVEFEVEFTGDPAPEARWFRTVGGHPRVLLVSGEGGVTIVTDSDSSLLTIDEVALADDNGAIFDVEVRNYKATVSSTATLTVAVAPTIESITPAEGDIAGGTVVEIEGDNLDDATGVTFGGDAGTAFSVTEGVVTVTTPAHAVGAVNVVVLHPLGNITEVDGFEYTDEA